MKRNTEGEVAKQGGAKGVANTSIKQWGGGGSQSELARKGKKGKSGGGNASCRRTKRKAKSPWQNEQGSIPNPAA